MRSEQDAEDGDVLGAVLKKIARAIFSVHRVRKSDLLHYPERPCDLPCDLIEQPNFTFFAL